MAYLGQVTSIPIGQQGLYTDNAQTALPPNALIDCLNVAINDNRLSTQTGSDLLYASLAESNVVASIDYIATGSQRRTVAALANGSIYKDGVELVGYGSGYSSPTLDAVNSKFVQCGVESANRSRKLVLFNGVTLPQVLTADGTTTRNLGDLSKGAVTLTAATEKIGLVAHGLNNGDRVRFGTLVGTTTLNTTTYYFVVNKGTDDFQVSLTSGGSAVNIDVDGTAVLFHYQGSLDWLSGSYPTYGFVFLDRLLAFGNTNNAHTIYYSTGTDHENFVDLTSAGTITVYPGEGEKIVSAISYKGSMLLFKWPSGVYAISEVLPDLSGYSISKLVNSFGIAGPHSWAYVLDDVLLMNSSGSITSIQATTAYGDLEYGDVLANSKVEQYFRDKINYTRLAYTHAVYYSEKKQAYFTVASAGSSMQDAMIIVDINTQTPRILYSDKDKATTLSMYKSTAGFEKPFYGTVGGAIYVMDGSTYAVGGSPYLCNFKTVNIDFSYLDQTLASKTKLFDFLEVVYSPQGDWTFSVAVFIDDKFIETIDFSGLSIAGMDDFTLDEDVLDASVVIRVRKPLHGSGKFIAFQVVQNSSLSNFKIEQFVVSFRIGDERQVDSGTK